MPDLGADIDAGEPLSDDRRAALIETMRKELAGEEDGEGADGDA